MSGLGVPSLEALGEIVGRDGCDACEKHLELIKQSHVILNFLAMEGKLSSAHMDAIWQAAQMKYCSKQVHDLLPPLIKNLEAGPVLHLYELVQRLPVKEHTEQTIYLAQVGQG